MSVSGPGQKRSIRRWAVPPMSLLNRCAASTLGTCTMSGCAAGRPLSANTWATLASSSARAPRP
jgi:hypothetical protein